MCYNCDAALVQDKFYVDECMDDIYWAAQEVDKWDEDEWEVASYISEDVEDSVGELDKYIYQSKYAKGGEIKADKELYESIYNQYKGYQSASLYSELKKKYTDQKYAVANKLTTPNSANTNINFHTLQNTKYSMIFDKKPADVIFSVQENMQMDARVYTVKIGKLEQHYTLANSILYNITDDMQIAEMLLVGFADIIEVRPDVANVIVECFQPKPAPKVKVKHNGSVGRSPELKKWENILKTKVKHPVTGGMGDVETTIIDLNDSHKWTREKIADWLETLDIDIKIGEKKK